MTDGPNQASRYPGYDVLAKRHTPSWDQTTRDVVAQRLATPQTPRFLTPAEWRTADALCRRIMPQTGEEMPLVALLDAKLDADDGAGFRVGEMPYMREAWQQGLAALDGEAAERHDGRGFADLTDDEANALLEAVQQGKVNADRWVRLDAPAFFARRILYDVPALYYGLPQAWNELGFGGPASPRGYVRLEGDHRDPWEAAEANAIGAQAAERANRHVV